MNLFRLASLLNSLKIISSGNPRRIAKHVARKAVMKEVGKRMR